MIIAPKQNVNILDSNINIIEENITVYDDEITYNAGDLVQLNANINRKYKAVQEATISPIDDVNFITGIGTFWIDFGATNYKRAFDALGSSKTTQTDLIYYKFKTSDVDVLYLAGLSAMTVRVKITNMDNDDVILDETSLTSSRDVGDWFDWTYSVPEKNSIFYKILPMAYNTEMELWIESPNEIVEVAHIVFGRSKRYGLTITEPKPVSSRRSLTSKVRDEFGNIVTRRKAKYRRMSITCLIEAKEQDAIEERLNSISDTPCVFVGDEKDGGYKALSIFGELKDHDMPISLHTTTYQLEVEGYI